MHAQMQCSLRSVRRASPRTVSQLAISRRPPQDRTARSFHNTPACRNSSDDRPIPTDSPLNNHIPSEIEGPNSEQPENKQDATADQGTPSSGSKQSDSKEYVPYGSALRRAMRNRKPRERSRPISGVLPSWFHERNFRLLDQSGEVTELPRLNVRIGQSKDDVEEVEKGVAQGGDDGKDSPPESDPSPAPEYRYALSSEVWEELQAAVRAGLTLPAPRYTHNPATGKPHLALQYPGEGGIYFLDAIVNSLANDLKANVITLNAQDIAELYDQQRHGNDESSGSMVLLGYEVYQPNRKPSQKEAEEESEEKEEEESEEDEPEQWRGGGSIPLGRLSADSTGMFGSSIAQSLFGGKGSIGIAKVLIPQGRERRDDIGSDEDLRCLRLINELLDTSLGKRSQDGEDAKDAKSNPSDAGKRPPLILQIQDYKDILSSRGGALFLGLLHRRVMSRRRDGDQVMIVGTVSEGDVNKSSDKAFPKLMPRDYDQRSSTIIVTPAVTSKQAEKIFSEDAKKRILEINIRHLKTMLRSRLRESNASDQNVLGDPAQTLDESTIRTSGLDLGYWPFDLVHRVSTLTLGCAKDSEKLKLEHIQQSIELVGKSDQVKCDWLGEKYPKSKHSQAGQEKERKSKPRVKCNTHEEKLLNGVVDAESINTTFSDVHVPPDTVDALKTLTSLSLVRPEAFTYGVLSTDKIPGLLLYGPPGTGKTLLAKAVARESGATVLEVSGSDVYDMYVGEGEKNVKAIFTLAKKLSPCVVFIDEADAIFGSRTGASSRTSHRELINQFLREWDGMNSLSAFIMVATNRPFDLDDAVLRRLPRRLLVDLPSEKDRLAILKIHLKEESLDSTVDLAKIASLTPFYSGSDLKNLSVAAALACVREENDLAAQYKGDEPYKYPERRMLRSEHFDKAMEEISASISEDMSSLTAIKKFDEKFGDRKGRRKKPSGWGFSAPGGRDTTVETGRVRN